MRRYHNYWKIYDLPLWQIKTLSAFLDYLLWRRRAINNTVAGAHWIGRYPERMKITIRVWRYRLILWLFIDSVTE